MIDEMRVKELVEIFEGVYDKKSQAKMIVKEANGMMKDYAERAELGLSDVKEVYSTFEKYKNGKIKWGEDDDNDVAQLLVQVMDVVVEGK